MKRLSLLAPVVLGPLLLVSCDPYGGPPGYTGSPTYGHNPNEPPVRGDGYNDPGPPPGGFGYNPDAPDDTGSYTEDPSYRNAPPRNTPPRNTPPARTDHPVAERTKNPNQVLSPYEPYNVIDVTGFKSGQLAKDPSNGKIFRVP